MSSVTLGRFLFERLNQLQVQTIFGLPGDFNLSLLDKIYEVDGMKWAGNANELNAAYAADGYSRVKGLACLVTTFGVGELSALNGVAGLYAEHVGMLHVVGVPSILSQAKQLLLHHTLGNGTLPFSTACLTTSCRRRPFSATSIAPPPRSTAALGTHISTSGPCMWAYQPIWWT